MDFRRREHRQRRTARGVQREEVSTAHPRSPWPTSAVRGSFDYSRIEIEPNPLQPRHGEPVTS